MSISERTGPTPVSRRLLLLAGGALAGTAVAGCTKRSAHPPAGTVRHRYGSRADQFGDLYLPAGTALGTVVVLHGGFWLSRYAADLMVPICKALTGAGWAAWNLEYARLGDGGGWPRTFEDVAAGVDKLAHLDAPQDTVVFLGHSAGGQLAVWAGSRTAQTPGGPPKVTPTRVVSQAGVLDLAAGYRDVGGGTITRLMGGTPDEVPGHYRLGDPIELVPAPVPVRCVHGVADHTVPASQSTAYVAAAKRAGGQASYVTVPGDHFAQIDPSTPAWGTVLKQITRS